MSLIRFVGQMRNQSSPSRLGIFQTAYQLRDESSLPDYDLALLNHHLHRLKMHMKSPEILQDVQDQSAISRPNPEATEPLKRIKGLSVAREQHGYFIVQSRTDDLRIIVYEDGWKIVAKPKKGDR